MQISSIVITTVFGERNQHLQSLKGYEMLDITPEQIWQEWATKKYGNQAADHVIHALKPSFEIVNKLFFPQGVWFTNHTKLPPYRYAYGHINFRDALIILNNRKIRMTGK